MSYPAEKRLFLISDAVISRFLGISFRISIMSRASCEIELTLAMRAPGIRKLKKV